MKKQLLLINPDYKLDTKNFYEPIELGIIASITPPDEWDVKILDLRIDDICYDKVDVVAITARILNINDAYQICQRFKKIGVFTVIGGIHTSLFPNESSDYADCIVVGEAESIWGQLLNDFSSGNPGKIYYGSTNLSYKLNRKFYNHYYKTASLQLSRGCPLACDFCGVSNIHKQKHNFRSINCVIEEIKSINHKTLFFTDENIYGFTDENRKHIISVFKEMINLRLNKKWIAMISINAALDEEFLYYARKSGCRLFIIGFEAEDEETLRVINKTQNLKNLKNYKKIIRNIHKFRIAVCGVFIFGLETDTLDKIERRKKYILKSSIDSFLVTLLTPLPGSKLFERHFALKNLIYTDFPKDWDYYNFGTIHFKNNKINNLDEICSDIRNMINSPYRLFVKFILTIINTRSFSSALYSNFYFINHFSEHKKVKILKWLNQMFEKKLQKKHERLINKNSINGL